MPYGFNEIEHTADWAIQVWAPDLEGLFSQAALGMCWLMGLELEPEGHQERIIKISAHDYETLLVAFLNEVLYEMEIHNIGFAEFPVQLSGLTLESRLLGAPLKELKKAIKAVTYHNLEIKKTSGGFKTTIVFDV